jgi:hypothetical protein
MWARIYLATLVCFLAVVPAAYGSPAEGCNYIVWEHFSVCPADSVDALAGLAGDVAQDGIYKASFLLEWLLSGSFIDGACSSLNASLAWTNQSIPDVPGDMPLPCENST